MVADELIKIITTLERAGSISVFVALQQNTRLTFQELVNVTDISRNSVSKQLKKFLTMELVSKKVQGKATYYFLLHKGKSIARQVILLAEMIAQHEAQYELIKDLNQKGNEIHTILGLVNNSVEIYNEMESSEKKFSNYQIEMGSKFTSVDRNNIDEKKVYLKQEVTEIKKRIKKLTSSIEQELEVVGNKTKIEFLNILLEKIKGLMKNLQEYQDIYTKILVIEGDYFHIQ